jgi:uncharacterized protein (UPF0371 family)
MKKGFDTEKYLHIQELEIIKRAKKYPRFYLEFGGHLIYDGHASRVLPGYNPETKLKLLKDLSKIEKINIIYCVNAMDISGKKRLGDFKLNYTNQTLRDIRAFKKYGLKDITLIITRYQKSNSKTISKFKKIVSKEVNKIYIHNEIPDYLKGPKYAIKGYTKNPYIKLNSRLIIITGAAGGSGKMATAMSQIYHDIKNQINPGYAKFETFPVWNLPLSHPINLAYEAATADLQDRNEIDPYHLKYYKKKSVNYNRDIQNFSILMKLANMITKNKSAFGYHSPTDMGIGNTKAGITDEEICKKAAIKEIRRRMIVYTKEFKAGRESKKTLERMNEIMEKVDIKSIC